MAVLAVAAVGGAIAEGAGLSFGLGFAVFGTIAGMLMQPHPHAPVFKSMSSAWGQSWPIVYNTFRVAGQVIQAGDITPSSKFLSAKKGQTAYKQTFAVAFCEGPQQIGRIWADNIVIYDPRPLQPYPNWQANTQYGAGDIIQPDPATKRVFIASVDGVSGPTEPTFNFAVGAGTRDGTEYWVSTFYKPRTRVGKQYSFDMAIYNGTEDQLPDSVLEEQVGAGMQPAYRGLVYLVFDNFDLSKFGNRIPNFEVEILGNSTNEFVSGAILYGAGYGVGNQTFPFTTDDSGNLYMPTDEGGNFGVVNSKTLTNYSMTQARFDADAAALGVDIHSASGWAPISIPGTKYFLEYQIRDLSLSYTFLLYETNTDGSATVLGAQSYNVSSTIPDYTLASILPGGDIVLSGSDFYSNDIQLMVIDGIVAMQAPWTYKNQPNRYKTVTELGVAYAATPGPYDSNYPLGWVGGNLYVALNKSIMDWHNNPANVGHPGFCTAYQTLAGTNPGGCMLKIEVGSVPGSGILTYIYDGITTDFGFPFSDEGKTLAGGAGNTTGAGNWDTWGPPTETQTPGGTVTGIFFVRAYSDAGAKNEVGVTQFTPGTPPAFFASIQGAPFDASYSGGVSQPKVQFINDALYMTFQGTGGNNYARIGAFQPQALTLADICADVSTRVGLGDITSRGVGVNFNYTGLASVIPTGCAVLDRSTARSFLESMQPAFFYDLTDIGNQIIGTLRANASETFNIPESDLAANTNMSSVTDKLNLNRVQDLEIPQDLSIAYYDSFYDYQHGSMPATRNRVTQYSSGRNTISVPVVMTPGDAANAADRSLYMTWMERNQVKLSLPLDYVGLTPADFGNVVRGGENHAVRITKATLQPSQVIDIEGVSEDLGIYTLAAPPPLSAIIQGARSGQTINPIVAPALAVMDTASLRTNELDTPGVYLAGCASEFGGGWDGETVQDSPDGSVYTTEQTISSQATMGTTVGTLGDWTRWPVWDRTNTVDVTLLNGVLGNASEDDMVNTFANLVWFANGEIAQFKTAELIDANTETYRLSTWLRGRFGTEAFTSTHANGEQFVFLDQSVMQTTSYASSLINSTRYWKGINDADGVNSSPVYKLTMTTRRLMPYAPYFIRASRDGSGNITFTGLRRKRFRGTPLWSPPETDNPITMEIDVLNGVTVVRTLKAILSANGSGITSPSNFTAYYAAADQVTDFGSTQKPVSIKAYELNALVGRGYGKAATV